MTFEHLKTFEKHLTLTLISEPAEPQQFDGGTGHSEGFCGGHRDIFAAFVFPHRFPYE